MIRVLTIVAAVLYVAALAYITLSPVHAAARFGTPVNLVPFRSIADQLGGSASPSHKAFELIGNSVLLLPFGTLLATVLTRRSRELVVVASVAAASTIELLQWALSTGRSVDVDDVLLNSLESLAGFWVGALFVERSVLGLGYLRRSG